MSSWWPFSGSNDGREGFAFNNDATTAEHVRTEAGASEIMIDENLSCKLPETTQKLDSHKLSRSNERVDGPGCMLDSVLDYPKERTVLPSAVFDRFKLPDTSDNKDDQQSADIVDSKSDLTNIFLDDDDDVSSATPGLLRDLETRAITVSQLIQEVKGIYAGLVMVEEKCIEIVSQQAQDPTKLSKEQWQALIALHRTLLNEHHDFFSASHYPVTEDHELRELAVRYAMPARMWRYGIYAFLELLRHRLPKSLEHMLSFVYLSYLMMALLMETVPDFRETWIECVGDLARYRMAVEEADLHDREIRSNTTDLSSNRRRIQHHLAVLARPNIMQQFLLHNKALVTVTPFNDAGEGMFLLFNSNNHTSASTSCHHSTPSTSRLSGLRAQKNADQWAFGWFDFEAWSISPSKAARFLKFGLCLKFLNCLWGALLVTAMPVNRKSGFLPILHEHHPGLTISATAFENSTAHHESITDHILRPSPAKELLRLLLPSGTALVTAVVGISYIRGRRSPTRETCIALNFWFDAMMPGFHDQNTPEFLSYIGWGINSGLKLSLLYAMTEGVCSGVIGFVLSLICYPPTLNYFLASVSEDAAVEKLRIMAPWISWTLTIIIVTLSCKGVLSLPGVAGQAMTGAWIGFLQILEHALNYLKGIVERVWVRTERKLRAALHA